MSSSFHTLVRTTRLCLSMSDDEKKIVMLQPARVKLASPEGAECFRGPVNPPADPAEAEKWADLIKSAKRGGPPAPGK